MIPFLLSHLRKLRIPVLCHYCNDEHLFCTPFLSHVTAFRRHCFKFGKLRRTYARTVFCINLSCICNSTSLPDISRNSIISNQFFKEINPNSRRNADLTEFRPKWTIEYSSHFSRIVLPCSRIQMAANAWLSGQKVEILFPTENSLQIVTFDPKFLAL